MAKSDINAPQVATIHHQGPRVAGQRLINADSCYYPPAVKSADLLLVDFDSRLINEAGLYVLEEVKDGAIVWRGCRRFDIHPGKTMVDLSGEGDWTEIDLASVGWKVAGKVDQVFKPSI